MAVVVGVVVAAVVLAGCASGHGPVRVTGLPNPAGADHRACASLVAALPASLGAGLGRRSLDPPTPLAAAWGAAPAVLTCGASGVARSYRPDAELAVVDDVGWFAERDDGTVRLSTPTRRPQVILALPADLPAFGPLVALAPPILRHTKPA